MTILKKDFILDFKFLRYAMISQRNLFSFLLLRVDKGYRASLNSVKLIKILFCKTFMIKENISFLRAFSDL